MTENPTGIPCSSTARCTLVFDPFYEAPVVLGDPALLALLAREQVLYQVLEAVVDVVAVVGGVYGLLFRSLPLSSPILHIP